MTLVDYTLIDQGLQGGGCLHESSWASRELLGRHGVISDSFRFGDADTPTPHERPAGTMMPALKSGGVHPIIGGVRERLVVTRRQLADAC
jgi:hypothetical protein